MNNLKLGKNLILIILAVILITAVSGCQKTVPVNTNQESTNQEPVNTGDVEDIDTSEWKTYRNEERGFSVKYPNDWKFDKKTAFVDKPEIYGIFLINKKGDTKLFIFPFGEFDRGIEQEEQTIENIFVDSKKFIKKNYEGFFITNLENDIFRIEGYYNSDSGKLLLNKIIENISFPIN